MNTLAGLDRLNAVFLKELRQALRGRTFAILFPITVAIGVALAITVLVDAGDRTGQGPNVLQTILGVLAVAVLGLVPFSTFQSMAGEWDEGTHDLLVLSHLSPTRIVLGKLLTASVESALYVCAFLPLLLFTFLLSGVDVRDVIVLVALLYAASIGMSCVAMSLAGLSRTKFWRVILLACLAGVGLLAWIGSFAMIEWTILRGRGITSAAMSDELVATVAVIGVTGILAFAFAATRIAHPEDDRSGPVRIAITALLVVTLAWFGFDPFGGVGRTPVWPLAIVLGVLTAILAVFFVTEPERLPRRTATRVPKNAALALLATPFLPGGGRGVLWWMLQLAILLVWAFLAADPPTMHVGSPVVNLHSWTAHSVELWIAMMAYFLVYIAGMSLALTSLRRRSYGPLAARLIVPSVAVLSMVLPVLVGFLTRNPAWIDGRHALNPFWVGIDGWGSADSGKDTIQTWAIFAGIVVLLLNAPRIASSFREIQVASRARRAAAVRVDEVAAHAT